MKKADKLLHDVARLYGVQNVHYDGFGRLIEPPREAILSVLHALGAPVERMEDLAGALRERREFLWRRAMEPVVVAWDGGPLRCKLRLRSSFCRTPVRYRIALESGEQSAGDCRDEVEVQPAERMIEGTRYVTRRLILPVKLPLGYHRLFLRAGALTFESFLISSLSHAHSAPDANAKRWGLFCPLYALTSERSWGAGDFADLEALIHFTGEKGGAVVGTLPLLPTFLDEPFNPSPYAPVSRLFWNEFYLDVARIAELRHCPAAGTMIDSSDFHNELESLSAAPLTEYRRLMGLKRSVLEKLLGCLLNQASRRRTEFLSFVARQPRARDYAAFRAAVERKRAPWEEWPLADREGTLQSDDYDEKAQLYHLYVQWLADEQMREVSEKAKAAGLALYLDFPLGVNRDGYDVWRERELFALDASGGAPPDSFFINGQNWGFPPLHPETIRQQGYRYYLDCLRHHLQHARVLRIDHVMGLHRLYWIPRGCAATEGVCVRYRAEEFYAVLSQESHRHQAEIVGENLGTVPPYVNAAMAKHGISGMVVGQFGVAPNPQHALAEIPSSTAASLNTHDTATFAGFWAGHDIRDRLELGLLDESKAATERAYRSAQKEALIGYLKSTGWLHEETADSPAILRAWLGYLSASDSDLVLINLEDLWLEPLPQNVPGTWRERPNWQRKARYSMAQIRRRNSLLDILAAVDQARRRGR